MNTPIDAPLTFRQISFTNESFSYLKDLQAYLLWETGTPLTNSEVLSIIIDQHRTMFRNGVKA